MIRFVQCRGCELGFTILGKPEEFCILDAPEWAEGYPCPASGCSGTLVKGVLTNGRREEITVDGFFRAVNGLGFGKSIGATPEHVRLLLLSGAAVSVELSPVGGEVMRTIVKSITFDDGTIMHFASSNEGACVYLVEAGRNFDAGDSIPAGTDSQDSPEDRTQTRHSGEGPEGSGGWVPHDSADEESDSGPGVGSAGEILAGEP